MMPHPPSDRRAGEALYRLLLRLYPADFRERYGEDMVEFYRDRVRSNDGAGRRLFRLWTRLVPDLIASACAERFRPRNRGGAAAIPPGNFHRREDSMSVLSQDIRYAFRSMLQRPGFTAVVLMTLALGIGANAAIFTVVNAVLLRPLPFAHVERIVDFAHQDPYSTVSEPEFVDYQRGVTAFDKLAAYNSGEVTLTAGMEPVRTTGTRVSRDFFDILGVKPILGRTYAPDEYSPLSKARITIISHALWQQQFAGDSRVIGRTIEISGAKLTVIGVMPPGFNFPNAATNFWSRWRMNPDSLWTRNNHYLRLVGRLAPNATIEQARAQVHTLEQRWRHDFPETYAPDQPLVGVLTSMREYLLGQTKPYLLALLGAVGFILLIACVNVANLLLVRGEARRKEFAIRVALGASGSRVVRQLLTESMMLALLGGLLGIGVAWLGTRTLIALAPAGVPRLDQIGVDLRVALFTAAVTLFTGICFGLVPAARAFDGSGGESAESLREAGRTSGHTASRAARRTLVITEVALAVVMLSGAGLLIRSLAKLQAVDLGFNPENLLTMQLTLPSQGYTDTTADELFRQVVARVKQLPRVRGATLDGSLPISGNDNSWSIMLDGRVVKTIAEAPSAKPNQVTPDYFATMGIPLRRGRGLTESDRRGAALVVVINETMAKQMWPGANPVGHTLKMFSDKSPWVTVVGVAGDVRSRGIQQDVPPTMFFPYSQSGSSALYQPSTMTLAVRYDGNPGTLTAAIRNVVHTLDARVPISAIATMDQVVGQSIASRRFSTTLLAGFAALALALAGIGIYGVIAYGVSQRTYEIGVRMALGASDGSVLRLVMREGIGLTSAGVVLGLAGALAVDRLLSALLVGVSASDAVTMVCVTAILATVAVLASAVPAWRATAVSPTAALRNG